MCDAFWALAMDAVFLPPSQRAKSCQGCVIPNCASPGRLWLPFKKEQFRGRPLRGWRRAFEASVLQSLPVRRAASGKPPWSCFAACPRRAIPRHRENSSSGPLTFSLHGHGPKGRGRASTQHLFESCADKAGRSKMNLQNPPPSPTNQAVTAALPG